MSEFVLKIYDMLRSRPVVAWAVLIALTAALAWSLTTLSYKEDISDFLPLDERNHTALSVYQDISGANRIYAIVSATDSAASNPQLLAEGVEDFAARVEAADSLHYIRSMMKTADMEKMMDIADQAYGFVPYFLTEADYARIDSLMSKPDYIATHMADNKQSLLFPSSGLLTANIARDPLNLFSPILGRLRQGGMDISFDTYDGYILSPDGSRAIVIMESAFGASESDKNGQLARLISEAADSTAHSVHGVEVNAIGGPLIAAANAGQIKSDSILAIAIAGVLILALLIYVFRNLRNILLIVVSIGWGWLFAMGMIAALYDSVSVIVIGIASVILGIAVNYPLHLIDHLRESSHPREAMKEIVAPLVVGNVTTVGAFLCLVPLNAPALHDLGLFSSLLLIGTILFVLIFLPHAVRTRREGAPAHEPRLISAMASFAPDKNRWVFFAILILTGVFAYFSRNTEFDTDMRNINYMTPAQRNTMAYFQSLVNESAETENLYIVSNGKSWDEALAQNAVISHSIDSVVAQGKAVRKSHAGEFLLSKAEQEAALQRWQAFKQKYARQFATDLPAAATAQGFSPEAFEEFNAILSASYSPQDFGHFREFVTTVFNGTVSEDKSTARHSMVQTIQVPAARIDEVKSQLETTDGFTGLLFDVKSMNGSIANTLSDDFNYIGIACGCIVFLFLWLSFGRIELAIVSFLPMAFSWIWILGLMSILDIKFNIVNIILATFIFGQGDDYTIFMTEGLTYEYAYRRRVLAAYKNSIIISALIMFIGIGTLLFAKHPALRSLGEVTVVGMLTVVLMAYMIPPLLFRWLTHSGGQVRFVPLTLPRLCRAVVRYRRASALKGVPYGVSTRPDGRVISAITLHPSLSPWQATLMGSPVSVRVVDGAASDADIESLRRDQYREIATPAHLRRALLDRFLYKGHSIERAAARAVRHLDTQLLTLQPHLDAATISLTDISADRISDADHTSESDHISDSDRISNSDYLHISEGVGVLALYLAMLYPEKQITCRIADADARQILTVAACFAPNLSVVS